MFLIISTIFLSFYLHDRIVIKSCAYNAGMEISFFNKIDESVKISKDKIVNLDTLVIQKGEATASATNEITIKYKGKFNISMIGVSAYITNDEVTEQVAICKNINFNTMYAIKNIIDMVKVKK